MRAVAPLSYGWPSLVGVGLAVALSGLLLAWLVRSPLVAARHRETVGAAVAVGYLGTLAAGWLLMGSPRLGGLFDGDWIAYHQVVTQLSQELTAGPERWSDRGLFLYLMAISKRIFGSGVFGSVVVNAAFAGTSVLLVARLTQQLGRPAAAPYAAGLASLFPPLLIWYGLPLREAMVGTLTLVSASAALTWHARAREVDRTLLVPTILLGCCLVAMLLTRREAALMVAASGATAVGLTLWAPLISRRYGPALLAATTATMAAAIWWHAPELARTLRVLGERIQNQFAYLALGLPGSGRGEPAGVTSAIDATAPTRLLTPVELLAQTPLAALRAAIGPAPTQVTGPTRWLLAESLLLMALAVLVVVGLVLVDGAVRRSMLVLLVPAVTWFAVSGQVLGNWGIVSRMRVPSWLLLLPIAAVGAEELLRRRRDRRPQRAPVEAARSTT